MKIPLLVAASALLSLKSDGLATSDKSHLDKNSLQILDNIMTVMVVNANAKTVQDSSVSEDSSSSSYAPSCWSATNSHSKTRRGSVGKPQSQKIARVVKATKKTFRKPSLDLTTPVAVAVTVEEPKSAYKRIPSKLLKNPSIWKSGMRLAMDSDAKKVNSLHKFVRAELLECFVLQGSYRVGLRCVHCAGRQEKRAASSSTSSMSTFFPKSLQDLYRSVCTWQRIHFKTCPHMPQDVKEKYWRLKDADRTRGKKSHWITSAYGMGFRNVDENRSGIVYCPTTAYLESEEEDAMDYQSDSEQLIF
jgi:hypothetical protein